MIRFRPCWQILGKTALSAGFLALSGFLSGCQLVKSTVVRIRDRDAPPPAPVTYSQYHLDTFAWEAIGRVLVLPVLNESDYTRAGNEFHAAFTSELQRLGRFEVISAPMDDQAILTRTIHRGGQFDEATMLEIGKQTRSDVVVHITLTQYSPYPRPRIGVVIQAVSPLEGKVVASVDGLWDTTDAGIAELVRAYYRQRVRPKPAFIRNSSVVDDDAFATELALDSPALFQRWASQLTAKLLVGIGNEKAQGQTPANPNPNPAGASPTPAGQKCGSCGSPLVNMRSLTNSLISPVCESCGKKP